MTTTPSPWPKPNVPLPEVEPCALGRPGIRDLVDPRSAIKGVRNGASREDIVELRADDILDAQETVSLRFPSGLDSRTEIDVHCRAGLRIGRRVGASTAVQRVGACAALKSVIAAVAREGVIERRADDAFKTRVGDRIAGCMAARGSTRGQAYRNGCVGRAIGQQVAGASAAVQRIGTCATF